MEYALQTKDLVKVFPGSYAVHHVNMNIVRGDIYGFIGKNGAGKTTMMRLVSGLAKPTSGSIEIFGSKDLNKQRKRMGCMIENPGLYPNMTAKQNLEVFRKTLGIAEKNAVEEMLSIVGLDDAGSKKVKKYSLGMKQRLGIAIALLGNPDFLVLDEPINGLDPEGIKDVRNLLLKLCREKQITIFLSSHILGELSKIANRYGIIKNGKLIDEFTKEELDLRCRRCLKIELEQMGNALKVLETDLGITNYDVLPDNTLRVFERLEDAAMINAALVRSDNLVKSIALSGQDLEGYFMDMIGGIDE